MALQSPDTSSKIKLLLLLVVCVRWWEGMEGGVCVCVGGYFTELGVSFLSVLVTLQHEPTVLVPGQFVSHTDGGAETRWGRGLEGGGGALHLTGGHVRDTLSSFDSADSRRPAATKRSALRGFTTSESLQRKCF